MNEISSDVSPSNLIVLLLKFSKSLLSQKGKKTTLVRRQTKPTRFAFSKDTVPSCLCYNFLSFLLVSYKSHSVTARKRGLCSRRNMAVRGLEVRVLRASVVDGGGGGATAAASSHCCDRSAFLLAFIFSRRFTRWLLVISISSILSRAVRNWGRGKEGKRGWGDGDEGESRHVRLSANVPRHSPLLPLSEASSSRLSAHLLLSRSCPPTLCTWRLGLRVC